MLLSLLLDVLHLPITMCKHYNKYSTRSLKLILAAGVVAVVVAGVVAVNQINESINQ